MSTQLLFKKINKEVVELRDDVKEIKKFLFAPLKDPEGEYRMSFIRKMLSRAQNRGPFYRFTGKESFLKHVSGKK